MEPENEIERTQVCLGNGTRLRSPRALSWRRSLSESCKCLDLLLSLPNPSTGSQSPLVATSVPLVPNTGLYTCNTIFSLPLLEVGAEELLGLEFFLPLVPPPSWSCSLVPGLGLTLFSVQVCWAVEHFLIVSCYFCISNWLVSSLRTGTMFNSPQGQGKWWTHSRFQLSD